MDAGIAALLGAAVGSVATLGTAYITGVTQDRLQERQWLRQVRREAYGAFLGMVMERLEAGEAAAKAVAQGRYDDSREHTSEAASRGAAMRRAAAVVAVEGPAEVSAAAVLLCNGFDRWVLALGEWTTPGPAQVGDAGHMAVTAVWEVVRADIDVFTDQARQSLSANSRRRNWRRIQPNAVA